MSNTYTILVKLIDKQDQQKTYSQKVIFPIAVSSPHLSVHLIEELPTGEKYIETIIRDQRIGKPTIDKD